MTLLCSPFGIIVFMQSSYLGLFPKDRFHIIHGLSLLFNKIFVTSSDLGVLLKDLCATSSLIFHISYSLTKYFCHHLTLVCSQRTSGRPHQSGLLPDFQRHLEVTDLPVLFFITPWIFMEEKTYRTHFHACKAGNFIKLAQKSSWSPNSQRPPKVTDLISLLMSFIQTCRECITRGTVVRSKKSNSDPLLPFVCTQSIFR